MKRSNRIIVWAAANVVVMCVAVGCGILAEHTIDKDSYYNYIGERPGRHISVRKYEAVQGIVQASAGNYGNILKHLDQYLAITKDKHQYINFIHANINLPPAMVAEKLLSLHKVNSVAFVEISQIFIQIQNKLPSLIIAQEYSNACLLKSEISKLKVGMEADILSKKQIISDLAYQNLYAASAAEFLNKQCILASSPEMREAIKIIQQGK